MRVCQVLGSASGGVASHVGQVCGLLAEKGEAVIVAGPAQVPLPAGIKRVEVPIGPRPSWRDVTSWWRLRRLARQADVIHAHGLRAGALVALAKSRFKRPRIVLTLHNLPVGNGWVRAVGKVLRKIALGGADHVLVVSPDLAKPGEKNTEIAIIAAPTSPQDFSKIRLTDDLEILTVARLAPQKGIDLLVEAAQILARQDLPSWQWFVVGDGPLTGLLQGEGVPAQLHAVGRRSDVPGLLKGADVVVSTSYWEGQPVALREAVYAGSAIVATDVGGTSQVLGKAACYCEVDADAISKAVAKFLEDEQLRREYSKRALLQSEKLGGPKQMLEQLLRCYQDGK